MANPTTEVAILADIVSGLGGIPRNGATEVGLLSQIVGLAGGNPTGTTEVALLSQWLNAVSPSTYPATTEVPILMQLVSGYGGVPTGTTEVILLLEILAIVLSADSAPVNTSAPVVSPVSGSVGTLFSCTTGSWTDFPTSYAYQWYGDAVAIGGATSSAYTAQVGDIGTVLTCGVIATNSFGPSTEEMSNATNPISADSYYLRPDGVSRYLRPGGVFAYVRP